MLKVNGVVKTYGEAEAKTTVLNKASFTVEKGEICSIIGPSGSGKSTLLNLIGCLDSADDGKIIIDGEDVSKLSKKERSLFRRKQLGFIFQFYNLVPNLTVLENIRVCEEISNNPLDKEELLKTMGLWEHRNKFPSQISGGQQQRCAIIRALVKNPKILLCDEPTGALDSKNTMEIMKIIKSINEKYQTTILMVTHNEELCKLSNHVIKLVDGKVVKDEKVEHPLSPENIQWS